MIRYRLLVPALALLAALAARPQAVHAEGWGDIKGQVVWAGGAVPAPEAITPDKDVAACLSCGPLHKQSWVINPKNNGIQYVMLWLLDPANPKAKLPINPALAEIPAAAPAVDQPCCQFEPHALAIRQGQEVIVKNSSKIAHNINWAGNPLKNPGGNLLLAPAGSYTIKGLKADRLPLKLACNIHGWMNGWLGVFDHPYFAVTDANGNFEIKGAPAGKYNLVIWQESIGYMGGAAGRNGTPIEIKAGGATDLGKFGLKP